MYTAVPHNATVAPSSHMMSDNPTLPDERRITLGVANILRIGAFGSARDCLRTMQCMSTHPVPMTLLNMSDAALNGPNCRLCSGT